MSRVGFQRRRSLHARSSVHEKDISRIEVASTGEEEDPFAALQDKAFGVHGSICPAMTALFESAGQTRHCGPSIELRHERYALEEDERQQSKDVLNEAGLGPKIPLDTSNNRILIAHSAA